MGRGDVVGEVALFAARRTADVDALSDVRLLGFGDDDLERVRRRHPRIAATVFLNLNRIQAERLSRNTQRLDQAAPPLDVQRLD
jgi:CRP-like cAMP-binding protein